MSSQYKSVLPIALRAAQVKRIILHWTAGSHVASALDRRHYHFLTEWDGSPGGSKIVSGKYQISANDSTSDGDYAAHVRRLNTGSVGWAICGMAGARERPFHAGRFPIQSEQWFLTAKGIAELCLFYDIEVTSKTVLSHCEVPEELGVPQAGKWDISRVPFIQNLSWTALNDNFRGLVKTAMQDIMESKEPEETEETIVDPLYRPRVTLDPDTGLVVDIPAGVVPNVDFRSDLIRIYRKTI